MYIGLTRRPIVDTIETIRRRYALCRHSIVAISHFRLIDRLVDGDRCGGRTNDVIDLLDDIDLSHTPRKSTNQAIRVKLQCLNLKIVNTNVA